MNYESNLTQKKGANLICLSLLSVNRGIIEIKLNLFFKFRSMCALVIDVTVTAVTVSGILGHSVLLPCDLSTNSSDTDRAVLILWYKDGTDTPIYRSVHHHLISLSCIFRVQSTILVAFQHC